MRSASRPSPTLVIESRSAVPAISEVITFDGVLDGVTDRRSLPRRAAQGWSLGGHFAGPVMVIAFSIDSDGQVGECELRREVLDRGSVESTGLDDVHDSDPALVSVAKLLTDGKARQGHEIVEAVITADNRAAATWAVARGLRLLRQKTGLLDYASPALNEEPQVTSPLRRASALLNQRILFAAMEGRQLSVAHRLDEALRPGTDRLTSLIGLPANEWHAELFHAIRAGRWDATVAAALRRRRGLGLTDAVDVDLVLKSGPEWSIEKQRTENWLRTARPDLALALLDSYSSGAASFEFTDPLTCRVMLGAVTFDWFSGPSANIRARERGARRNRLVPQRIN